MIPSRKPYLTEDEAMAARMRRGPFRLGDPGSEVKEFEDRFAARTELLHAVAVSSCTTALHLALPRLRCQTRR
jgi:perosamine synthetase